MNDDDRDFGELEQMLRAAEGYVQASIDLRPCVLEAARANCQEKRVRRYLFQAAVLMMLVSGLASSTGNDDATYPCKAWLLGELRPATYSGSTGSADGGLSWRTVDALVELRLKQAEAIRRGL
jgi:hypothetical protein